MSETFPRLIQEGWLAARGMRIGPRMAEHLVSELRAHNAPNVYSELEARRELEAARAERNAAKDQAKSASDTTAMHVAAYKKASAERERITTNNHTLVALLTAARAECERLRAEVERLTNQPPTEKVLWVFDGDTFCLSDDTRRGCEALARVREVVAEIEANIDLLSTASQRGVQAVLNDLAAALDGPGAKEGAK